MFGRSRSRAASAPQVSTGMLALQQEAQDERAQHRQALIDRIEKFRRDLRRAEADIFTKSAPIEKRLTALRSELAELESQLEPLARDRLHAMGVADREIGALVDDLKKDAAPEVSKFQAAVEKTREHARHGWRHPEIFHSAGVVSQIRVVSALAELLEAYNEAGRIARESAEVPRALDEVRERIRQSGIELIG
jgi:DNA repair exonuclease SbcCD ATPase subunit